MPAGLIEAMSIVLVLGAIIAVYCWYRRKFKGPPIQTSTRANEAGDASEFSISSLPPSEQPLQNDSGAVRDRALQDRLIYGRSGRPNETRPSTPSEERRTVNNRLMYGNRRATDSYEPLTVRMPLMPPLESHSTVPTELRFEHSTRVTPGSNREQEIINRLLYRRPVSAPSTDRPAASTNNVTIGRPSEDRRRPTPETTRNLRVHIPAASDTSEFPPSYAEVAETPPPLYSTLVDGVMSLRNNPQAVPSAPSVHDEETATSTASQAEPPPPQYSSVALDAPPPEYSSV